MEIRGTKREAEEMEKEIKEEGEEKSEIVQDLKKKKDMESSIESKHGGTVPKDVRKRKVAVLLAYLGTNYKGLQKNPDAITVEGILEKVFHKIGGISQDNFDTLQKIGWSRAGRTDKGVHAAGQIIAAKIILPNDFNPFIDAANEELPEDIRILGMQKCGNKFNSKNCAFSRTYKYILPVSYLFNKPLNELSMEEVEGGVGKFRKLMKLYEGSHMFHNFTVSSKGKNADYTRRYIIECTVGEIEKHSIPKKNLEKVQEFNTRNGGKKGEKGEEEGKGEEKGEEKEKEKEKGKGKEEDNKKDEEEMVERKFVTITIHGQSFMLHQIRKMVDTATQVIRYNYEEEDLLQMMEKNIFGTVMAPSCGLYLQTVHYDQYNKTQISRGNTHCQILFNKETFERKKEFEENKIKKKIIEDSFTNQVDDLWLECVERLLQHKQGIHAVAAMRMEKEK